MHEMFCGCESLKSLPNISKWNIKNVKEKSSMFKYCNEKIIPSKFKYLSN